MTRGDVWWLELPEEGRRPVCVLTRDAALPVLRSVLVAMVTRTVRGIPTEVRLGPEDGMPTDCAVSLDNLRTVPRTLLTTRVTALTGVRMNDVCRALAVATGC
ncbi:MAG: type II toxin-antitoxin system PemK/MazF family toxin [Thermoleophilaceae bacterium]